MNSYMRLYLPVLAEEVAVHPAALGVEVGAAPVDETVCQRSAQSASHSQVQVTFLESEAYRVRVEVGDEGRDRHIWSYQSGWGQVTNFDS